MCHKKKVPETEVKRYLKPQNQVLETSEMGIQMLMLTQMISQDMVLDINPGTKNIYPYL